MMQILLDLYIYSDFIPIITWDFLLIFDLQIYAAQIFYLLF